jgi:hypothetical protein
LALAVATLSCEVMEPETSLQLFASEQVITSETNAIAFGVRVNEGAVPVVNAEVIFGCEFVVNDVTLAMPESPPLLTDENGLTGIGLDLGVVRQALGDQVNQWSSLNAIASVRGMSASDSLTVPVKSGDPGSSSGSERLRPLGTFIRSLQGVWQVDEMNLLAQPSDAHRR